MIINSHIPLNVKRRDGDCNIAIVINAIYEYGGLAICCLVPKDFSFELPCSSSISPHNDDIGELGLKSIEGSGEDDDDE